MIAWPLTGGLLIFLEPQAWPALLFLFSIVWAPLWLVYAASRLVRPDVAPSRQVGGWLANQILHVMAVLFALTFFFPFSLFVLAYSVGAARQIRQRRGLSFLEHICQAVTMNLPMPQMLAAAARSETPGLRARLWNTAAALEEGDSLGNAVRRCVPEISAQAVSLIEAGERTGRLPQVLARLVDQGKETRRRVPLQGNLLGYPLAVGMMLFFVVSMFMLLIAPKFEKIFEDFEVRLPTITLLLMRLSRWLGGALYPNQVVPGLVWIGLLVAAAWLLISAVRAGHGRALTDPLLWVLPVTHGIQRDRGMGDVCHLLEELLQAGMPMHQALAQAGGLKINRCLSRRVRAWAAAVEAGSDVGEAARRARIPALTVGILAASANGPGMVEALGFLRRFYDARFSRVAALVQGAGAPATTLVAAGMVGFVALSLFMPLVTLIWAVNF